MTSEFDLIRKHFTRNPAHTDLAVGDDAALMTPAPGMQLVVSTDMLVSGTHFFPDVEPETLGWKTLAVNVSDIVAMGAQPRWAVLALALPDAEPAWVSAFAEGLFACAHAYGVDLVGGDTTRGPLTLCVTIMGEVPVGTAITRAGAQPGDSIWVSGQPGRAALGLAHLQGKLVLTDAGRDACLDALHRPQPRLRAGLALRGMASAMLDVSDGLLGDLRHILERSGVGADIELDTLPLAELLQYGMDRDTACNACLSGGDDYELLFTAPATHDAAIARLAHTLSLPLTRIGTLNAESGALRLRTAHGETYSPERFGYDHFA